MFNNTPETIVPKAPPTDPCPMTIGTFPEEQQQELPLEDTSNEN